MKPRPVHFLTIRGTRAFTLCNPYVSLTGYLPIRTTDNHGAVTCPHCIELIRGITTTTNGCGGAA